MVSRTRPSVSRPASTVVGRCVGRVGDGPGANWGVSVSVSSRGEQRVHAGTAPNCICYVLYTGLFRKAHSCVDRFWFFFCWGWECGTSAEGRGELQKPSSTEDTEGHGERQHLFVRGGRGGARRTATPFWSTEDTEGHGERQHLFGPRRTRRGTENGNIFLSAEDAEGTENFKNLHLRRTRRGTENGNTFLSAEDTEGHGERQHLFLSAEDAEGRGERQRRHLCPWRTLFEVCAGVKGAWLGGGGGDWGQMHLWRGSQLRSGGMVIARPVMWLPVTSICFHWPWSVVLTRLPSWLRKAAAGQAALPALL